MSKILRGTVLSFDAATWTANVMLQGSDAETVMYVGEWVAAGLMDVADEVAVLLFGDNPTDTDDGLVLGPYGSVSTYSYPELSGLATGAVLRATSATTAAFGQVDLLDADAFDNTSIPTMGGLNLGTATGASAGQVRIGAVSNPRLYLGDGATLSAGLHYETTNDLLRIYSGTGAGYTWDFTLGAAPFALIPASDNTRDLGSSARRVKVGYFGHVNVGTATSSGTGDLDASGGVIVGTNITMAEAGNIILGTATGTKIGTATTQKLGFFNSTPIVQPANTTDLRTALINLGLYATGGASPLNLNGGALQSANHTFDDGANIIFNTTTGTKIGTATNQKLGFYNATPIVRGTAFTQTYSTAATTITQGTMTDPAAYSAGANGYSTAAMASAVHAEVIALKANMVVTQNVLNGVIDQLQALGLFG